MDQNLFNRLYQIVDTSENDQTVWVYSHTPVASILQNGPQCGIVALCMALNTLGIECSTDELMTKAREAGYTKSGEIFHNDFILNLAKMYYSNCELVETNSYDDLESTLTSSKFLLVAYDCDFNFEPCFKQGVKAHWAIVTGYIMPTTSISIQTTRLVNVKDVEEKLKAVDLNRAYAICRQGKSKSYGVWSFKKLIDSNKQLKFIDEKRADDEFYVKPENGDLESTLASKILAFY